MSCLVLQHVSVYVFQYFCIMPLEAKSWFKLSLVLKSHAVTCCPVSRASNCSFLGSCWELDQEIYLWHFGGFCLLYSEPKSIKEKSQNSSNQSTKTPLTMDPNLSSSKCCCWSSNWLGGVGAECNAMKDYLHLNPQSPVSGADNSNNNGTLMLRILFNFSNFTCDYPAALGSHREVWGVLWASCLFPRQMFCFCCWGSMDE